MSLAVEVTPLAPYLDGPAALRLEPGATVADALECLGIVLLDGMRIGIWGQKTVPGQRLRDGDRIEFYKPLARDPKVARQDRVARERR